MYCDKKIRKPTQYAIATVSLRHVTQCLPAVFCTASVVLFTKCVLLQVLNVLASVGKLFESHRGEVSQTS